VTFPLADALCWLLASRAQILDVIELEKKGPENPTLAEGLPGLAAFLTDLCHVQAARAAGEVGRICAELVHATTAIPRGTTEGCASCYQAEDLDAMESLIPGIASIARGYTDVIEIEGAHPTKPAHACGLMGSTSSRACGCRMDGCLTGSQLAKDRAAEALTKVMIPERWTIPHERRGHRTADDGDRHRLRRIRPGDSRFPRDHLAAHPEPGRHAGDRESIHARHAVAGDVLRARRRHWLHGFRRGDARPAASAPLCRIRSSPRSPMATPVAAEKVVYLLDPVGASRRSAAMRAADALVRATHFAREHSIELPYSPPFLEKHGGWVFSLGQFLQYVGNELMASGTVQVWPGMPVAEALLDDAGERVCGVRLLDQGVDRQGRPDAGYMPGMDIRAALTVVGDGPVGAVGRQLDRHFGLPAGHHQREWALGMKMVIDLPAESDLAPGTVIHTFGYPEPEIFGFLYVLPDHVATVGIFVPSWFHSPMRTVYRYLQHTCCTRICGAI